MLYNRLYKSPKSGKEGAGAGPRKAGHRREKGDFAANYRKEIETVI